MRRFQCATHHILPHPFPTQSASPLEKAQLYKVMQWLSSQANGKGSVTMSQSPDGPDMWTLAMGGKLKLGLRFFLED